MLVFYEYENAIVRRQGFQDFGRCQVENKVPLENDELQPNRIYFPVILLTCKFCLILTLLHFI